MDPPDGVDSRHRRRPVGLVGNLLHPATATGDPEGVAHAIADSQLWVPDHLAIVLGLILVLGGLVAIARSIHGGLPGALARLGSVAAVAGVTVGLILVTSTAWPPSSSPRPGQPRHPDHHLPHRHHPMAGLDGRAPAPQAPRARAHPPSPDRCRAKPDRTQL